MLLQPVSPERTPNPGFSLRPARPADVGFVVDLSRRVFLQFGSYDRYIEEWFGEPIVSTFVAEAEGAPVGFVMLAIHPASPTADAVEGAIAALEQGSPDAAPAAGLAGGDGGDLQPGLRVERVMESVTAAAAVERLVTAGDALLVALYDHALVIHLAQAALRVVLRGRHDLDVVDRLSMTCPDIESIANHGEPPIAESVCWTRSLKRWTKPSPRSWKQCSSPSPSEYSTRPGGQAKRWSPPR